MMRRRTLCRAIRCTAWLMVAVMLHACEFRQIELDPGDPNLPPPEPDLYELMVKPDWSGMKQKPTGMTVLCYPQDGTAPSKFLTNRVDSFMVSLPENVYDILIYNQSEEEYPEVEFQGMDRYHTAAVSQKYVPGMGRLEADLAPGNGYLSVPPEDMYVCRMDSIVLNAEKEEPYPDYLSTRRKIRRFIGTTIVKPQPVIRTGTVTANVKLRMTRSRSAVSLVQGTLSNLASTCYLATNSTAEGTSTLILDHWQVTTEGCPEGFARFQTTFTTYGEPDEEYAYLYETETGPENENDSIHTSNRNILRLYFAVNDELQKVEIDVTEQVDFGEDGSTEIMVGAATEETATEENPFIDFSDVPEQTDEGGFRVDVDAWDDAEDVRITVK